MEENLDVLKTCSPITPQERQTTDIIEDGPRICPLCSSEIKFFFINLNEKVLLCENKECEFPFGYEELQFTRIDDMSDIVTIGSKPSLSSTIQTASVISTASWSEIEKINRIYEADDGHLEKAPYEVALKDNKNQRKKLKSDLLIKKNVEEIKGLSMELKKIDESRKTIKNEKWLKNLMYLEGRSGVRLLKPEELNKVKRDTKELKIDIDKGNSTEMSSIKIQIGP